MASKTYSLINVGPQWWQLGCSPDFLTFTKVLLHQRWGRGRQVKGYALNEDSQTHDLQHGKFLLLVHTVHSHQLMSDPLVTLWTSHTHTHTYSKLLVRILCWKVCNTISPTLHRSRCLTQPCYKNSYWHIMWSCHGSYAMLNLQHISSWHTVYSDK